MKSYVLSAVVSAAMFFIATGNSQAQSATLTGTFRNNDLVRCPCNVQGLLNYMYNGEPTLLTLCFDTEPGDYYELFNGETITVQGWYELKTFADGKEYYVFYVNNCTPEHMVNRKMLYPQFIKQQPPMDYTGGNAPSNNNGSNSGGSSGGSNGGSNGGSYGGGGTKGGGGGTINRKE